ncbi:DsbA family protein [Kordiimonas sp.]|uniref:DsbA family protein n=1 Tax=Kordiimonas sp. TaxID=1970157 RepID=UPI003B52850F
MTIKSTFVAAALTAAVTLQPASAQDKPDAVAVDPAERAKIEAVLQDYLLENPEIVMYAIRELQRRQSVAQMLPSIEMYRSFLEEDKGAPVIGNPDGDVTIVEFFDYRCGYCRRHFPEVMRLVKEDGNIRLLPKQFPILDRPEEKALSRMAAQAALAANKQGKFEEFHVALMGAGASVTEELIYKTATSVGLDLTQLKADMADKLIDKRIGNTLAIGQDIGFEGTPGYIIGKDVVLGAEGYDRLRQAVARAREKLASASPSN